MLIVWSIKFNSFFFLQPLIIKEVRPPQPPAPPPLRIRQQAPALPQPPPLILREKPPSIPASVAAQTIVRRLGAIPVPPRSVIIERLPAAPAKPRKKSFALFSLVL